MLRYYKTQYKGSIPAIKNKWFLRIKHGQTIELEGLAKHMADHNSPFSEGVIFGVLKDMTRCIEEILLGGDKVKIGDLAIFSLGISCKGVDDPNNATVQNIRNFTFNAMGTGATRPRNIVEKAHLRELDEYAV